MDKNIFGDSLYLVSSHPKYGDHEPATIDFRVTRMWLLYFINAFQSAITANLSAYVTSGFESHSLIPVILVVSSVMSAATYMPLAKILNLWDRSIGFLLMTVFMILGLVLSATCSNIAIYCASQVRRILF